MFENRQVSSIKNDNAIFVRLRATFNVPSPLYFCDSLTDIFEKEPLFEKRWLSTFSTIL